jgi:hypothetical protein
MSVNMKKNHRSGDLQQLIFVFALSRSMVTMNLEVKFFVVCEVKILPPLCGSDGS